MNSIFQTLAGWLTPRTPSNSMRRPHTMLGIETLEDRQLPSASLGTMTFKQLDSPVVAKTVTVAVSEKASTQPFAVLHNAKSDESAPRALDLAGVQLSRETAKKSAHLATGDIKGDATDKKSSQPATNRIKSDAADKKSIPPAANDTKGDATDKKSSQPATGDIKGECDRKKIEPSHERRYPTCQEGKVKRVDSGFPVWQKHGTVTTTRSDGNPS